MSFDPRKQAVDEHKRWMGYLQPEGVVVSAVALVDHGVQLDASTFNDTQERFLTAISRNSETSAPFIPHFAQFARGFLGWRDDLLDLFAVEAEVPDALRISTGEFGELLHPDAALRFLAPAEPAQPWMLLLRQLPPGTSLDAVPDSQRTSGWVASPAQKFERLLRGAGIPIGILTNGAEVRLLYAPRGENVGSLTFPVRFMTELPGRAVTSAFEMLLSHRRLISVAEASRLPALLKKSREYQSAVSTLLSEQVLHSLYELLRGFQAADQQVGGRLLSDVLARDPNEVYHGLLNILLRLVFLLFAEDRGVMPAGRLYQNHYSVHGLFERLRAANERYPDTMDSRFGAWAQLLTLFRLVHAGCKHPELRTPARQGNLFDFDRFPYLEGRASARASIEDVQLPLVSDGTLFRVLEKLLILDGERLSYRTLDVEEVGSVYQTIMGFCVEMSVGNAIALKGKRKNGGVPAAPIINLDQLLAIAAKDRAKWLKENADTDLNGEAEKQMKAAASVIDLLAALDKRIDRQSTPMPVRPGGLYLQPTDERRRSGSHYTPRSFTRPIVQKTLEPILTRLGRHPKPEEILALKICDIAVGSAAFLVETCRQLADELIAGWHFHKCLPVLPPDEDEVLHAMRLIAQRCLYGVDRNPMAVDLAKLSLWLATLAKDHPFTFLDHAIRCGDSLVGLTRRQIETFTWKTEFTTGQLWEQEVRKRTADALRERQNLLGLGDDYGTPQLKREKLERVDELLDLVRFIGDAAVAAFFAADKDKAREAKRLELADRISAYLNQGDLKQRPTDEVKALRGGKFPVTPFHWEIEFPEVFERENPGFDGIVGNPPFAGRSTLYEGSRTGYIEWLCGLNKESHGNADLVAHFFRHAFNLLRPDGCFGLIATNTIGQGDTRSTGLRWICTHGGTIYAARKRHKWPGQAAVVVSVVWTAKGNPPGPFDLDGNSVPRITAYLFHAGGHENPEVLSVNKGKSFQGSVVVGMGFTFDDTDTSGVANELAVIQELKTKNAANADRIFPYIGGDEVNDSPTQEHHRYIFNLSDLTQEEARTSFPDLLSLAEDKVKPEREAAYKAKPSKDKEKRMQLWWKFSRNSPELYSAIRNSERVLVCSRVGEHSAFVFLRVGFVFSERLVVFPSAQKQFFATLQSRAHELWARFFSATQEDRLMYAPSDCFETFPFPAGLETNAPLEAAGREYYEFRAALMVRNNEGLTKTYNRFHDPEEASPDILKLRDLHSAMDAAVLTAYGWTNLLPQCRCEFLLDFQDEETESGAEESTGRKKKKPWRYRWPDDVRDEVLARLLKLNAERAAEERRAGQAAAAASPAKPKKAKEKKSSALAQCDLIDPPQPDLFG